MKPRNNPIGMPALGFGTLISNPALTITATKDTLEAGFRHFDCAERYRNEIQVGEALQAGLATLGILPARMSMLPQKCGIRITDPNASKQHSRQV